MGITTMTVQAGRAMARKSSRHGSVIAWAKVVTPGAALVGLMLAVVLVSGLAVVYSTHQYRYTFHEFQQLREQRNALEVEWGQLLIEQSTFGLESRIERKAMDELQLIFPEWSRTVMVQYE